MPSEITDEMVEAAYRAYFAKNEAPISHNSIRIILNEALATRPIEAGSVVERLRESQQTKALPDRGDWSLLGEAADLIQSQAAAIAEREERIERLEAEYELTRRASGDEYAETWKLRAERLERERNESGRKWRDAFDGMHNRAMTAEARANRLEKALRFYASERRYNGANQRNDGTDEFTSPNAAYIRDVTRDGDSIARAALQQEGER